MFTNKAMLSRGKIARKLDMSTKKVNRLFQRIRKNGSLVPRKRGRCRKITKKMVDFLKKWFENDTNVGKSFKYAY